MGERSLGMGFFGAEAGMEGVDLGLVVRRGEVLRLLFHWGDFGFLAICSSVFFEMTDLSLSVTGVSEAYRSRCLIRSQEFSPRPFVRTSANSPFSFLPVQAEFQ